MERSVQMQQNYAKGTIGAGQLFLTLFVARIVILLSLNTALTGGEKLQELLPSCLGAYLLSFLLILPVWLMRRGNPKDDPLRAARRLFGRAGLVLAPVYAVYFLCFGGFCLSLLLLFMANVMEPLAPLPVLAAVLSLTASYAAFQGIETIGRTAAIVTGLAAGGLALIVALLSAKIDPLNFLPFFEHGGRQAAQGGLLLLARSDGLTALAFLGARARGRLTRGFVVWNTAVYTLTAAILAASAGAMGGYLDSQLFPVYAAAASADAGVVQGMDAVLIGVWIFSLLVKLSTDLYLFRLCAESVRPAAGKGAAIAGAVFTAGLAIAVCSFRSLQRLFYGVEFFLVFTLVCACAIPLLLAAARAMGRRGKKRGRRAAALLLALLLCLPLTGCQEQIRLNHRLLVEGIGIDRKGGEFVLTVQSTRIAEDENREVSVYSVSGPSVMEALGELTRQTGQNPLYGHGIVIAFGRSCAEYGVAEWIDFLVRSPELRPSAQLLMAEGSAADLLTAESEGKTIPAGTLAEILGTANINGRIAAVSLSGFVNRLEEDGAAFLPVLCPIDGGVEASGTALLDGEGRLLSVLGDEATRGLLFLTGEFSGGLETVSLPDGSVLTARLRDLQTEVDVSLEGELPRFAVSIRCGADVAALDAENKPADAGLYEEMEERLAVRIKKEAQTALDLCLTENQADVFRFSRRLRQAYPEKWREWQDGWGEIAAGAAVTLNVSVTVARVGQEDTPPIL